VQEGWEDELEEIDEELTEVAASLGAFTELAWVYSSRSTLLGFISGARGALSCAEKVRALAGRLPDEEIAWHAGYAETSARTFQGRFRAVVAESRELLSRPDIGSAPLVSELVAFRPAATLTARVMLALNNLGEFADVQPLLAGFREAVAREETPMGLAILRLLEGQTLAARGQPEAAARVLAEAVAYAEQTGSGQTSASAGLWLGAVLNRTGQFQQAVEVLSEALRTLGGTGFMSAAALAQRARAYLGTGQVAEARQDAETALAKASHFFEARALESEAHLSLAMVHAASQPPDYAAAEEEFAEAERCLRECEFRRVLAPALQAHGEMRLETRGPAAARPLLLEARELYAYMDRQADVAAIDALLEAKPPGKRPARRKSRS